MIKLNGESERSSDISLVVERATTICTKQVQYLLLVGGGVGASVGRGDGGCLRRQDEEYEKISIKNKKCIRCAQIRSYRCWNSHRRSRWERGGQRSGLLDGSEERRRDEKS